MSERISHAVLLNMESEAKPWSDTMMLIDEVRRLRGLILECAETVQLALRCADPPPDVSGRALVESGRELAGKLLSEARTIGEEQDSTEEMKAKKAR